jgi:DNA-binding beta-propeller fold protein YncE
MPDEWTLPAGKIKITPGVYFLPPAPPNVQTGSLPAPIASAGAGCPSPVRKEADFVTLFHLTLFFPMKSKFLFIGLCLLLLAACKKDEPKSALLISGLSPGSGPKTTIVTITGSGFSTVASENVVTLNGLACPINSATATELKITIPAKAGSGKLKVSLKGQSAETPPFTYIYTQVNVTTLAGSTEGDGGRFYFPRGVAVDKDGNVYVADVGNHKIKKITPSGGVSTLAGSTQGDGERFSFPASVAVDKDGNVYVADVNNHKIKKITPSGVVSTLAGSTLGDGERFNHPTGVAVDKDGNIYVADAGNHKIKKIQRE